MFNLLSSKGIHPEKTTKFFSNYKLINRDGKFNINAYLLADNNTLSIKVVRFDGKDKTVMSKRTDYGSRCLLLSVMEVINYFESINTVRVDLSGAERKEEPLFDFSSFREAWINACVHNDWSMDLPPAVYMFDDRIEIISYGGLIFPLTEDEFYEGTSVPVNRNLLKIFLVTKFVEQTGHGVPTIVRKYGKEAFSIGGGTIKVTIPLAFEREEVVLRKGLETNKKKLTVKQQKVYDTLAKDGSLSLKGVSSLTNISETGVKNICIKLQEYGLLEREGTRRAGRWITK